MLIRHTLGEITVSLWRFLLPLAWSFTTKTTLHHALDRIKGAPARTIQARDYVAQNARPGDPADVLRTLDEFSTNKRWLMSVGPEKGPLVQELAARLPANSRILELGAYCGYSSILIATAFGPDCAVVSIEIDEDSVASARANVAIAGLSDQISFVLGPSTDMIEQLEGPFDLVFLDHWKDLYKADLQRIEQRQLIRPGSIVVADNVGKIFSPDAYLDYVRNCGHYHCENRTATIEYTSLPDAVEISTYQP